MRMFGTAWYNRALFKVLITGVLLNAVLFVINTAGPADAEPAKDVYQTLSSSLKPDDRYGKSSEVRYVQKAVYKPVAKHATKVVKTTHYTIGDLERDLLQAQVIPPPVPAHKPANATVQ